MWLVSASASGFPGDEGTPRNGGRGGRADAGRGRPPAAGGNAGRGDHCAEDLSQEEILDLIVEAMLAQGGPAPEEDDLGDEDDGYAGSPWDMRDVPTLQDTDEQNCGPGPGFGSGQPLDVLRPGPALAGAADRVHTSALRRVSDDELTGMIKAWRRLTSWATARELGAIAELARRRPEEVTESDFARRARARRAASGSPEAAKRPAQLRPPSLAERTQRRRPPQLTELPGQTQRLRPPRLFRLAGLTRQIQQLRLPRLPRLAGRTQRLRRKLPPMGGPARNRTFPR